jgi:SET domain-containing protein
MNRGYRKTTLNKGTGTFASEPIREGELILFTTGQIITTEDALKHKTPLHCFQVELNFQLAPVDDLNGIFSINHSCNPNAGIRNATSLVAIRDIKAGEEICFDYAMTDCSLGKPTYNMVCLCGSTNCRGEINDTDWTLDFIRAKYKGYFSTYLAEIIGE